jgi:hypothetical protein
MIRIADTDPGPPLTIEISANRALENSTYMLTGFLRNDTAETYDSIGVTATFFDDQGFRQGPLTAKVPFLLLRPGESCPFYVDLAARRLTAFHVKAEGRATWRESAAVELRNVGIAYIGEDSVRVVGSASNPNEFMIKNVAIAGVLLDGSGQIVSLGSAFVLEENIVEGGTVQFDLRIPRVPYERYWVYAQAERDWE